MRRLLTEMLQINHRTVGLERAHRTGRLSSSSTRPRPVVVKFLRHKDKLGVLSKAKALKGTNIFINEDFPEAVRLR